MNQNFTGYHAKHVRQLPSPADKVARFNLLADALINFNHVQLAASWEHYN
jgi:hypothetical protein